MSAAPPEPFTLTYRIAMVVCVPMVSLGGGSRSRA